MPSLQQQDEIIAGDEWIHYQEIDIGEEDLKLKELTIFGTKFSLRETEVMIVLLCCQK